MRLVRLWHDGHAEIRSLGEHAASLGDGPFGEGGLLVDEALGWTVSTSADVASRHGLVSVWRLYGRHVEQYRWDSKTDSRKGTGMHILLIRRRDKQTLRVERCVTNDTGRRAS